jgi:hypothetical protein
MYYFDNFYPDGDRVLNLSDISTCESLARASTCERVSVVLDHVPDTEKVAIPVRIVEWMEMICERGTVSEKQYVLIWRLFDLLSWTPVYKA